VSRRSVSETIGGIISAGGGWSRLVDRITHKLGPISVLVHSADVLQSSKA
jgi:selenophosphate synthetase-related protein